MIGHRPSKDSIQSLFGGFGIYQLCLIGFMIPSKLPTSLQSLAITFIAAPVKYECLNQTSKNDEPICPCEHPLFETDVFTETIATTWNLICDREWMIGLAQTIFMLGTLIGSIIFGILSDKYGRRFSLICTLFLEIFAGISAGLTDVFPLFLFFRFLIGASIGGIFIVSFVLVMEFTGSKYRELVSCLLQIPFNLGYVLLPIIGYYIRSWKIFQIVISALGAGFIFVFWFIPETPRWLLITGKTEKAIQVIQKAARINKRPIRNLEHISEFHQSSEKQGKLIDLLKTPNMRKVTIFVIFNWTACGFGFYGISQYIGLLKGNIFVNVGISAALNSLATLVTYISLRFMSRKHAMIMTNLIAGVCLLLMVLIPSDNITTRVVLACIGNLENFVAFVMIYLYSAEIFPTVVRNSGIGIASMFSKLGSMIAPLVVTLGSTMLWLPPFIFGMVSVIAAFLFIYVPETKGCNLPDTIEEFEIYLAKRNSIQNED